MKVLRRIALASLFFTQLTLSGLAQSGIITTYVGPHGLPVNGVAANTQIIDKTYSVALDGAGGFYFVSSQDRVYRVAASGTLTLVAGNGTYGFSGDGGPATAAQLGSPQSVAVDSAGNVYIADTGNHRIRKVTTAGVISTVAGNGTLGFFGDGGLATAAQLSNPYGVTVDSVGNLYIADTFNSRIRKVTAAGMISTFAGNGALGFGGDGVLATATALAEPFGVALDPAGNLYIADSYNYRIRKVTAAGVISTVAGTGIMGFSGDGGLATVAQLDIPYGVAVDASGSIYIADYGSDRIRMVTATTGIISTVVGNGTIGDSGDGGSATGAELGLPRGVAVDSAGNLYIADTNNDRIRMVNPATGVISTVAGRDTAGFYGDGGSATSAQVDLPSGVATDAAGNLYVADTNNNRIREATRAGAISTIAGNGTAGFSGDGGPATAAELYYPSRVALDSGGNLYIADTWNHRIRKVTAATGIISTFAGNGTRGFSGDGGQATAAEFNLPRGVAVDVNGNLFIADSGNQRIRKVTAAGIISTVAGNGTAGSSGDGGQATSAELNLPTGVAVDNAGNLYIADTHNGKVRKVMASGIINTVPPSTGSPEGLAVDTAGNLYIADSVNGVIRMVTAAGAFSFVAGNNSTGFSGDGGPATAAQLDNPADVALDAGGNIYIADAGNNRIRRVAGNAVYFPQVAVGGGYTTTFTITNTSRFKNSPYF